MASDYNQKIDRRICRHKCVPTIYIFFILVEMELWCYGSH